MRMSSVVMFAVAIVFGLVAVGATRTYLEHQRSLMVNEVKEEKPAATLVVASQAMRFGALLEPSSLKEIEWASETIPEGAFRRVKDVLPDDQKRYVLSAVSPNEPILSSGITGPGQRATLSVTLDEGKRAVTMRVNDVLGVAGFVLPGDNVDVMLTRSKDGSPYVDVLLQGLRVLAIDQLSSDQADKPVVSRSVTFEVDTEQAQKLALGAQVGQLSLALRNVAHDAEEAVRRITVDDLAPPEIQPAPETAIASDDTAPQQIRPVRKIRVYRGLNAAEYTVR